MAIKKELKKLVQKIPSTFHGEMVVDLMQSYNALSKDECQQIMTGGDNNELMERLLFFASLDINKMKKLKKILQEIEAWEVLDLVIQLSIEIEDDQLNEVGATGIQSTDDGRDIDDHAASASGLPREKSRNTDALTAVCIRPSEQLIEGEKIYPMKRVPRGYCVIINNFEFRIGGVFEDRPRADEDGRCLVNIFIQLGFQVHYHKNCTSTQVRTIYQKFSKDPALKDHNCSAGIIMSHGCKGYVSLRNQPTGCWFIDAFRRTLEAHAHHMNLEEILQEVSSLLTFRKGQDQVKQSMEWSKRTWRKSLYFNPGLPKH